MTRHWPKGELPPDVATLLTAERDAPPPPADVEARVLARLAATVGLPAPPSAPTAPPPPPPAASLANAAGPASGLAGTSISTALLVGGSVVAFGAAAVTAVLWWTAPKQPTTPHDEAPAAVLQEERRSEIRATDVRPSETPARGTEHDARANAPAVEESLEEPWEFDAVELPASEPRRRARRPSIDTLAAERALLDEARHQLASGDDVRALAQLDAHRERYARGKLVEEREALSVIALARSGRLDEARARARRFEARYPQSLHGTAVRAAVEAR